MKLRLVHIAMGVMALLCSCTSSKTSLTYFENVKGVESGDVPTGEWGITLMPSDELFISVNSLVPEATMAYNLPMANPAAVNEIQKTTQPQQQTYVVDPSGYIDMPVLGRLHVEGMTTTQLKDELVKLISAEVADPLVRVELINFRVKVLGEVKNPCAIKVDREKYSVLDALADAGDLTEFGERENVLLIREENGVTHYHHLNLNDVSVLSSPYFYLQQNDVIYVEPNKIRKENSKYNQNNSFKVSVISTIVSACSVIASLVIALTVK